jgi:hypothetical protein
MLGSGYLFKKRQSLFFIVFILSLLILFMPLSGQETSFSLVDKIVHGSLFLALAISAGWRFLGSKYKIILWLVFYAVLSETLQEFFIPGRGYQLTDLLADGAGILMGYLVIGNQPGGAWFGSARKLKTGNFRR